MDVRGLLGLLDGLAPWALAEEWDNCGLLVGRPERPVSRVLLALDLRTEVLDQARAQRCEAVLTHHPVIFGGLAAVTPAGAPGALVLEAAERGVAVIAAHTNLDAARGGLNDLFAETLGMVDTAPLTPAAADPSAGLGRVGEAPGMRVGDLLERCVALTGTPVRSTADPDAPAGRVACCTGSGGSLIDDARAAGAGLYVTGDLRYHDHDRAEGLALVDATHAGVEAALLRTWRARVAGTASAAGVELLDAGAGTDPWTVAGGGD
ncbi:MAG: Nif3-like dinuclear metal center hexameric protein [Miltoncostaeaceae bacterium]